MVVVDEGADLLDDLLAVFGSDLVDEILSVEGGGDGDATGDLEGADDVVSDLMVGGGGESHDGRTGVVVFEGAEVSICERKKRKGELLDREGFEKKRETSSLTVRTKVMTPLKEEASQHQ
jgi:hypothetical protein